ncbi:hypothetical protein P7D66_08575 [Enterococcus avium]|uniref:hypothetical protein n=1 Tax=Enterococcus avium TaxID=33945 RepID=UPI002891977F|nr:hypothetical protein [Enterococcus avium]MDT2422430.1 hypothetical protein [Enterococcus avium]
MEESEKKVIELSKEISNLLKSYANPHTKIEITIDSIQQTSVDWSEPTDEWN